MKHLFSRCPLVPVVTIDDETLAQPLAEALLAAGIEAMEITLRTDKAPAIIESVAARVPGIRVGAGSVRYARQFDQAANAGAEFCVSPGFSEALLRRAAQGGPAFVPGAATPAEMLQLHEAGYDVIKFFPAEAMGGITTLKALAAPLPELYFFPTGGINEASIGGYMDFDRVVCVGGSWFIREQDLLRRDFEALRRAAAGALDACRA